MTNLNSGYETMNKFLALLKKGKFILGEKVGIDSIGFIHFDKMCQLMHVIIAGISFAMFIWAVLSHQFFVVHYIFGLLWVYIWAVMGYVNVM